MTNPGSKDPLHGITLEALLTALVARYGWAELAQRVNINCFKSDPSIKSSLKFLRRTPWARAEVEALYIALQAALQRHANRPPRKDSPQPADHLLPGNTANAASQAEQPTMASSATRAGQPAVTPASDPAGQQQVTLPRARAVKKSTPPPADDPWGKWRTPPH